MKKFRFIDIFVICTAVAAATAQDTDTGGSPDGEGRVAMTISSPVVQPGENVAVTCHVTNQSRESVVSWEKQQGAENRPTSVGTNSYINVNFKNTGRYEIFVSGQSKTGASPDVNYTLTINDTKLEDAGRLSCQLEPNGEEFTFVTLVVVEPVQSLQIFTTDANGTVTFLDDGDDVTLPIATPLRLGCIANGSAPAADVTLAVVGRDVTPLLNDSHTVTPLDNVVSDAGLVRRVHTVVLNTTNQSNVSFVPELDDATIMCRASLPLGVTKVTTVNVLHKPIVVCRSQKVKMYKSVDLQCNVTAHPPARVRWSWSERSGQVRTLPAGQTKQRLYTSMLSSPGQHTLRILRAYPQTFRAYTLTASEAAGIASAEARLIYIQDAGDSSKALALSSTLVKYMCVLMSVLMAYRAVL